MEHPGLGQSCTGRVLAVSLLFFLPSILLHLLIQFINWQMIYFLLASSFLQHLSCHFLTLLLCSFVIGTSNTCFLIHLKLITPRLARACECRVIFLLLKRSGQPASRVCHCLNPSVIPSFQLFLSDSQDLPLSSWYFGTEAKCRVRPKAKTHVPTENKKSYKYEIVSAGKIHEHGVDRKEWISVKVGLSAEEQQDLKPGD